MPLEAQEPKLDTRSAEEIFRLARERIPLYAPEWTDYNESDPGITLLQLFAWISEQMLYQMNRVPERMYIKFLQLLNMELRPAQPATVHLTFTPGRGLTRPAAVPQRTRAGLASADGEQAIFETTVGLDVIPLELAHVLVYDGAAFTEMNALNADGKSAWRPFGWTAQLGAALYLGFVLPPPTAPRPSPLFPQTMRFRVFLPPSKQAGQAELAGADLPSVLPPVTLQWEYLPPNSKRWQPLTTYEDESAAFTREGTMQVEGPMDAAAFPVDRVTDPHVWLRCRLVAGVYPAGKVPEISFIRPNVVAAENLSTVSDEILDESTGEPGQTYTLRRRPVQRDSLVLRVRPSDEEEGDLWERKDDFLGSKREDLHYTLNPTTGQIQFGDGLHGRIPTAGWEIVASSYRYGGGRAGNVQPGDAVLLSPVSGSVTARGERPAVGGSDEQTLDDLKQRAPRAIRCRSRAMSEEDFAELAKQAGGVARARGISLMHPDYRDVAVPGAVTVVIVPDNEDNPPVPSSDLLRSVARYLHPLRLLTTELYIQSPKYRPVRVQATVQADPHVAPSIIEQRVKDELRKYLNPRIWEFGADLYPTSLYDKILNDPNVRAVDRLVVEVDGQPLQSLDAVVRLRRDELVYSGDHQIVVKPYQDR